MEFEQITVRVTPMPRGMVGVAVLQGIYKAGRKPQMTLVEDALCEPGELAGIVDRWMAYAAQLSYDTPVGVELRAAEGQPQLPLR